MKNIILCLLFVLSYTFQAQSWFDNSCKNIDDTVTPDELKTSEEQNILKIIVNQAGEIEINGEEKPNISEIKFKEYVLNFVTNPEGEKEKADKPEKVIVQLKSYQKNTQTIDKLTSYIYGVYLYLWDQESDSKYNSTYANLNCKKREKIFNNFPLKIIGEIEKKPKAKGLKRGVGLPDFGGDTNQN